MHALDVWLSREIVKLLLWKMQFLNPPDVHCKKSAKNVEINVYLSKHCQRNEHTHKRPTLV
jgi:hypothetical protein